MVTGGNASRLYTVVTAAGARLLDCEERKVNALTPLVEPGMLQEVKPAAPLRSPAKPPSSFSGATICSNDDAAVRDRKRFLLFSKKKKKEKKEARHRKKKYK